MVVFDLVAVAFATVFLAGFAFVAVAALDLATVAFAMVFLAGFAGAVAALDLATTAFATVFLAGFAGAVAALDLATTAFATVFLAGFAFATVTALDLVTVAFFAGFPAVFTVAVAVLDLVAATFATVFLAGFALVAVAALDLIVVAFVAVLPVALAFTALPTETLVDSSVALSSARALDCVLFFPLGCCFAGIVQESPITLRYHGLKRSKRPNSIQPASNFTAKGSFLAMLSRDRPYEIKRLELVLRSNLTLFENKSSLLLPLALGIYRSAYV